MRLDRAVQALFRCEGAQAYQAKKQCSGGLRQARRSPARWTPRKTAPTSWSWCFRPNTWTASTALHELKRAVARDPALTRGCTLPVLREHVNLPPEIQAPNPIFVDLTTPQAQSWDLLLRTCAADLGCSAPRWLAARNSGHWLMEQAPDQLIPKLVEFLNC